MNNQIKEITTHFVPSQLIEKISNAFQKFNQTGALSGLLLILTSIVALIWVNLWGKESYQMLWHQHLSLSFLEFKIDQSLHIWINDGLMALFFFYVGLEIKREVMVGELSKPGKVVLPIFAAIGGMLLPALIFVLLQWTQPGINGWGIPMATDIAFSLGILMLLGKRVPSSLTVFLTAFAIVDDLGAILVIALFYAENIQTMMLIWAGLSYAVMCGLNIWCVRRPIFYIVPALVMWYFVLQSGIHPTVAGVLAALAIPTNNRIELSTFINRVKSALHEFRITNLATLQQFLSHDQLEAIDDIETNVNKVQPPLQRMEYALDSYVSFGIIPLFALSNAGVMLWQEGNGSVFGSLTLAVVLGLIVGKVVGILGFSWIAVQLNLAQLPGEANWKHILGIACLGGVGFTMSLFIANLAFQEEDLLNQAKIGILMASFLAGLLGWLVLYFTLPQEQAKASRK